MSIVIDLARDQHVDCVLRIADTSLILGQRLSEWCGHGPVIEEDIALTNIALDLIGQARLLLTLAGEIEGRGRDEDALAFLRDEQCVPQPVDRRTAQRRLRPHDPAQPVRRRLAGAAVGGAACEPRRATGGDRREEREGDALPPAARRGLDRAPGRRHRRIPGRMQRALDYLWPYTAEFFADDDADRAAHAAGLAPLPSSLQAAWEGLVLPVLAEATLAVPPRTPFLSHGRRGRHSEHMGHLLAPMQALQRAHPGANW
jgi:ring-1,2-phenylacetyl-CoA epoxidase subunit PaaC